MPRYDFECPNGHVTEEVFLFSEVPESIMCQQCMPEVYGVPAKRQLSTNFSFIVNKVMLAPSKRMRGRGGN